MEAEQLRAARALLRLEQGKLSDMSGVSIPTIKRLEGSTGPLKATYVNVCRLKDALETAGVIFLSANDTEGPGVRLKKAE
jgi:predicted transcriptional regulator